MTMTPLYGCLALLGAVVFPAAAQDSAPPPAADGERWNLFYQATSIGQYHPGFRSPYEGTYSLAGHPEAEASLTATLFFGLRLARDTQV